MNFTTIACLCLISAAAMSIALVHENKPTETRDKDGWVIPAAMKDEPADKCQAGAFAAYKQCRDEFETMWYDGGDQDEPKKEKAIDYKRCARVEEASINACRAF